MLARCPATFKDGLNFFWTKSQLMLFESKYGQAWNFLIICRAFNTQRLYKFRVNRVKIELKSKYSKCEIVEFLNGGETK